MGNQQTVYAKTMAQNSCGGTAQLIRAFIFASHILQYLSLIQNFKLIASICDCTASFMSDLVGIPNCWCSHAKDHMLLEPHREKTGFLPMRKQSHRSALQ